MFILGNLIEDTTPTWTPLLARGNLGSRNRTHNETTQMPTTITPAELSVVVQGPTTPGTVAAIESVRRHLPGAELILSTWCGSDTTALAPDVLILSDDPGAVASRWRPNNVNRQIISTRTGLVAATRPWAIKLRSDTSLSSAACLDWYARAEEIPRPSRGRIFRERIAIPRRYTRHATRLPDHPSDVFQLGRTDDLMKFWDCPFAHDHIPQLPELAPEQHLWVSCLSAASIGASEATMVANFLVGESDDLGLALPPSLQFHTEMPWTTDADCYTPTEWVRLSRIYSASRLVRVWKLRVRPAVQSRCERVRLLIHKCGFTLFDRNGGVRRRLGV